MSRSVPRTKSKMHLIVDLEKCFVFDGLTPEQLNIIARYCKVEEIDLEKSRRPLDFEDRIVFISGGLFEVAFYPDKKAFDDPNLAVVLNELRPGDLFGVHNLYVQNTSSKNEIRLRCAGKGRVITISSPRFETYVRRWSTLQSSLLRNVANRAFGDSLRLGNSLAKLFNTDVVLDRIESVASLMMDTMTGTGEQKQVMQRKFLLKTAPKVSRKSAEEINIEQMYLVSSAGDKEDRIRKKISDSSVNYTRTTKFGSGQNRKVFTRDISISEYTDLQDKKEGITIIKDRRSLKKKVAGGKIVFDIFQNKLSGLILCEIDFDSNTIANKYILPEFINEIFVKDVTEDKRYSNRSLAINGLPD